LESIVGEDFLKGNFGKDLFQRREFLIEATPTQPGGTGFPLFRTLNEAGPQGIGFDIEKALLKGPGIEQQRVLITVSPEMPPAMEATVEPLSIFSVDVLHQRGKVEEFSVELVPGGRRPGSRFEFGAVPVEEASPLLEFEASEAAVGRHEENKVVVVAQNGVGN